MTPDWICERLSKFLPCMLIDEQTQLELHHCLPGHSEVTSFTLPLRGLYIWHEISLPEVGKEVCSCVQCLLMLVLMCVELCFFSLFHRYVLNYNTLCFEDRFVSGLQACFFQNRSRYSNQDISHVLYGKNKQWNKTEEPTGIAMLPYQHATSNKISTLLAKCNMKTHQLPVKKTTQGKIGLQTPDVWCIPCGYGKVYVRQAEV